MAGTYVLDGILDGVAPDGDKLFFLFADIFGIVDGQRELGQRQESSQIGRVERGEYGYENPPTGEKDAR